MKKFAVIICTTMLSLIIVLLIGWAAYYYLSYNDSETIRISETGTRMYIPKHNLDFSNQKNIKVGIFVDYGLGEKDVFYKRVYRVKAQTPVIIVGKSGEYEIPVCETYDSLPHNLFRISTHTIYATDDNYYYFFNSHPGISHLQKGTKIPSGKPYAHFVMKFVRDPHYTSKAKHKRYP